MKKGDGTAAFSPDEHVCVRGPSRTIMIAPYGCSWEPMVPKRIFTLQRMKLTGRDFSQPIPAGVQVPRRLGLLHVMTFEFDDLAAVSVLDGAAQPFWRPLVTAEAASKAGQNCVVNLHIFADPPHPFEGSMARMNYDHPEAVLGELMQLTQSPDLRLRLDKGLSYCSPRL